MKRVQISVFSDVDDLDKVVKIIQGIRLKAKELDNKAKVTVRYEEVPDDMMQSQAPPTK